MIPGNMVQPFYYKYFDLLNNMFLVTQLSIPTHAQLQRHRLKFIKNHLKNFNLWRWSCACVGIDNCVILLRARYKYNNVSGDLKPFIFLIWSTQKQKEKGKEQKTKLRRNWKRNLTQFCEVKFSLRN